MRETSFYVTDSMIAVGDIEKTDKFKSFIEDHKIVLNNRYPELKKCKTYSEMRNAMFSFGKICCIVKIIVNDVERDFVITANGVDSIYGQIEKIIYKID